MWSLQSVKTNKYRFFCHDRLFILVDNLYLRPFINSVGLVVQWIE